MYPKPVLMRYGAIVCVLEAIMSMTVQQFEVYINSQVVESHFYEYLYDTYPTGNDEKIIWMMESGDYVEEFMDHLGVIYDEA